jgi:peptidoglycan/LPS O-acetylase OafA/YrhL
MSPSLHIGESVEASGSAQINESKPRLGYLDFTRAIAIGAVLIVHFCAHYSGSPVLLFGGKADLSALSSPVFFAVSGAAMALAYPGSKPLRALRFYVGRWWRIFPVFFIAYGVGLIMVLAFARYTGVPWSQGGLAPWRFIFTLLGVDGLALANGVPTFYILGEWFMGVIVILYLLYPLYHKLLGRSIWLVVSLIGLLTLAAVLIQPGHQIAFYVLMPLASFGFGMVAVQRPISLPFAGLSVIAIAALTFAPSFLDADSYNLVFGMLVTYVLFGIGQLTIRGVVLPKVGTWFAGISWQVILTHHLTIYYGLALFSPAGHGLAVKLAYVAGWVALTVVSAVVLKWVEEFVVGHVRRPHGRTSDRKPSTIGGTLTATSVTAGSEE